MARSTRYHAFTFTVAGSGPFPFDMLKYERASPYGEDDANALIRPRTEQREVKLIAFAPLDYNPLPAADRWKTFGWPVVPGSVTRVIG